MLTEQMMNTKSLTYAQAGPSSHKECMHHGEY